MQRRLIAANWKMHGSKAQALEWISRLGAGVVSGDASSKTELLLCPPATLLGSEAVQEAARARGVVLGGQLAHEEAKGAYTGDISAVMLAECGARYAIVGHSERRQRHGESDAFVRAQARSCLEAGLRPIICVGETLAVREAGKAESFVATQLAASLPSGLLEGENLVIAYEPVWAIGTGVVAHFEQIAAMHALLRSKAPQGTRLLYGGSVKPDNAAQIFACKDVDGALVGGASLDADAFSRIVTG